MADEDLVPLPLKLPRPGYHCCQVEPYPDAEPMPEKPPKPPLVPRAVHQLALHRPVTASTGIVGGTLALVTDGQKEAYEDAALELKPKTQWVQIDLGAAHRLYYVDVWHFHLEPIVVHDLVVQLSNDAKFATGVTTIYNNDKDNSSGLGEGSDNEYWESHLGRLIDARQTSARYVRLYSRGSTYNDPLNRYTEVEVWGL